MTTNAVCRINPLLRDVAPIPFKGGSAKVSANTSKRDWTAARARARPTTHDSAEDFVFAFPPDDNESQANQSTVDKRPKITPTKYLGCRAWGLGKLAAVEPLPAVLFALPRFPRSLSPQSIVVPPMRMCKAPCQTQLTRSSLSPSLSSSFGRLSCTTALLRSRSCANCSRHWPLSLHDSSCSKRYVGPPPRSFKRWINARGSASN